jgi:hypothetical protein
MSGMQFLAFQRIGRIKSGTPASLLDGSDAGFAALRTASNDRYFRSRGGQPFGNPITTATSLERSKIFVII